MIINSSGGLMNIRRVILTAVVIILGTGLNNVHATRLYQERGIYPNHSAEYVRTLNRFASTDTDAAFYNPAGLAFMQDHGLYGMFSSQTYYAKKDHTMDYYGINYDSRGYIQTFNTRDEFTGGMPDTYYAEVLAPVLPDLDIVYRGKNFGYEWAGYFDLSVLQAAPGMYFPVGLAVMDWGNLAIQETVLADPETGIFNAYNSDSEATRTEYFLGFTVGGAVKILDWLSASLGVRYINARGNMNLQVKDVSYTVDGVTSKDAANEWDVDTDYTGHGASIIIGTHVKPIRDLDIGFKFEYHTPITMKKKNNSFKTNPLIEASGSLDIFKDGSASSDMAYSHGNGDSGFDMQYPMQFNLGASYKVLQKLRVESSLELTLRNARDMDGREDDYKPLGFQIGACAEWQLMDNVKVSAGYVYNDYGIKDGERDEADMLLPSHTIGAGIGVRISPRFDLSVGGFYQIYMEKEVYSTQYTDVSGPPTYHALAKKFTEKRLAMAIGLTYRFLGSSGSKTELKKKSMEL